MRGNWDAEIAVMGFPDNERKWNDTMARMKAWCGRTLLKELKDAGLIVSSHDGITLSVKGNLTDELKAKVQQNKEYLLAALSGTKKRG